MSILEKTENEIETPLDRIFQCTQAKVLDFFLENYGIKVGLEGIQNNLSVDSDELEKTLKLLASEKLINKQNGKYSFTSNARALGFFEYFRATMDNNLDSYEYSK